MAEAITIPSPSVFLRSSPDPAPPSSQPPKHARRQSTEAKKKAARKANAGGAGVPGGDASVSKPKQSKSRNGILLSTSSFLSFPFLSFPFLLEMLADCERAHRLCYVQSKASEVRRGEAWLPTVQEEKCGVWRIQERLQVATI